MPVARPPGWTFQIGSMPRSGSAWFALLLNMHDGVFCFHDALGSYKGKYNQAPYSKAGYTHVGDSSSYCCALPHEKRAVFIHRDPEECRQSLEALNLSDDFDPIINLSVEWSSKCPTFEFNDIFGKDQDKALKTLDSIFRIVVPGVALNYDKAMALRPLKVELLENGPHVFDIEEIKWRMN